MAITLTESAAKHIQQQFAKRGRGVALRIGIKKSGCSGFSYTYDYADDINKNKNEKIFESCNTHIIVDVDNLPYLDGSQVDFIKDGLNSAFKFNNPNIEDACGCGTSVSFKGPVSV